MAIRDRRLTVRGAFHGLIALLGWILFVYWWHLVIPQVTGAGKDVHIARAIHDALRVALALEAFRKDTGAYPQTLNELIPQYLPAIPTDPLANQPLLYALHNGKPTIYAPGQDGQDRGGTSTNTPPTEIPASADWILFPPPNQ